MTLKINPVKLRRSIYFRVPNDIADLIGVERSSEVTLTLEQRKDEFLLIYSVKKQSAENSVEPGITSKAPRTAVKIAVEDTKVPLPAPIAVR